MRTSYFSGMMSNKRGGYALLLGLLIALVIGMIIYFKFMYGPVYEIGSGESDINPPWRQWHELQVRLYRKEPLGSPNAEQPQISEPLGIDAEPKQDGKARGQLKMIIFTDGTIQGSWTGAFYISKKVDFQVMTCNFKGFLDPKQVYHDEQGDNPTKLFFINKGNFMILETNSESGRVRNLMGDAYVRGWIDIDYTVNGELIITTDEKNFYRYTWQGKATEAKTLLLD